MNKGIKYMLFASFVFTLMKVCVKMVPHIPAIEIILFRSVISLAISLFFLSRQRVNIWGHNKPILIGRGIAGAIALMIYFSLLQQIPLATASTLQYLAPIFTAILGVHLIEEKVNKFQWLFFVMSFAGIIIIQGFDQRISFWHLIMGISASFFMGLAYNFIRKLRTSEHPLVIIFYFPLIMLPISIIWSSFIWVQPVGVDWIVLILIGIFTQIAQFLMTKAYQKEKLNKISIITYTGIIYSLAFGFFLFDETYNFATYIGIALVVSGVLLNVIWKKS